MADFLLCFWLLYKEFDLNVFGVICSCVETCGNLWNRSMKNASFVFLKCIGTRYIVMPTDTNKFLNRLLFYELNVFVSDKCD